MCLTCFLKPVTRKTENEMVFYKVLNDLGKTSDNRQWYETPFKNFEVNLGKEYSEDGEDFSVDELYDRWTVSGGGFHLFRDYEDADNETVRLKYHPMTPFYDYVVVKAIVPKGTPYIEGRFNSCPCLIVKKVRYEKL